MPPSTSFAADRNPRISRASADWLSRQYRPAVGLLRHAEIPSRCRSSAAQPMPPHHGTDRPQGSVRICIRFPARAESRSATSPRAHATGSVQHPDRAMRGNPLRVGPLEGVQELIFRGRPAPTGRRRRCVDRNTCESGHVSGKAARSGDLDLPARARQHKPRQRGIST